MHVHLGKRSCCLRGTLPREEMRLFPRIEDLRRTLPIVSSGLLARPLFPHHRNPSQMHRSQGVSNLIPEKDISFRVLARKMDPTFEWAYVEQNVDGSCDDTTSLGVDLFDPLSPHFPMTQTLGSMGIRDDFGLIASYEHPLLVLK